MILINNCGSSSLKFQIFCKDKYGYKSICKGLLEKIGQKDAVFNFEYKDVKFEKTISILNHKIATELVIKQLLENNVVKSVEEFKCISHRIVHGGTYFSESVIINDEVIKKISKCSSYAPLHNPSAVESILTFRKELPNVKMVAVFDTSFHTTIPEVNYTYAIPRVYTKKYGARKYGFHGTNYRHLLTVLSEKHNKKQNEINAVFCHVGNGVSLCAVKNGKSYDTSMGISPIAGVMMGTRSGNIDPTLITFMSDTLKLDGDQIINVLNKKSGLLGVSEVSNDYRSVESAAKANNTQALLALELFSKDIARYIVDYVNLLNNKCEAIVFSAGIGENSFSFRKSVIDKINVLKIKLDESQNEKRLPFNKISTADSVIPVYVIFANEELVILNDSLKLIN